MMKLFSVLLLICFALVAATPTTVRPYEPPTEHKKHVHPAPSHKPVAHPKKHDVDVKLAGGSQVSGSGENVVAVAADNDSGAAGVKADDIAIGAAGPGLAVGGAVDVPASPAAGLAGLF